MARVRFGSGPLTVKFLSTKSPKIVSQPSDTHLVESCMPTNRDTMRPLRPLLSASSGGWTQQARPVVSLLACRPCRRCFSETQQRRQSKPQASQPSQPPAAPQSSTVLPNGAVVFSGIQPTGVPHLGNYLGALLRWVQLQDAVASSASSNTQLYYSVVDLHALTSVQAAESGNILRQRRRETLAALLAIGLDPDRSVLFYQSAVPAHSELMWLLSCTASVGYLSRMTQWKVRSPVGLSITSLSPQLISPRANSISRTTRPLPTTRLAPASNWVSSRTPCSWPPTCSSTAQHMSPSARTSASTSSLRASAPPTSTTPTASRCCCRQQRFSVGALFPVISSTLI